MPLRKIFEDNFSGPGLKMGVVRPYYGTYNVSGGSLTIGVLDGFNNNWWDGVHRSPIVSLKNVGPFYTGDELVVDRRSGKVHIVEVRITNISSSGTECLGGVCLFVDRENVVYIAYDNDASVIRVEKGYNDSFSNICSSAVVVDPSVATHIYRVAWNPTPYPVSYDWFGDIINANTVAFFYSDDDGASFTNIGCTYTFEFQISNISAGLFLKNWGTYPASNIVFDYFRYYQAFTESQKFKKDNTEFEDNLIFPNYGGKRKHKSSVGEYTGAQPIDENNTKYEKTQILDEYSFLRVSQIDRYRSVGGNISEPVRLPGSLTQPDSEESERSETGGFYDSDGSGNDVFFKTANASIHPQTLKPAGAFVPGFRDTRNPEITRNKEYISWEDDAIIEIDDPYYGRDKVDVHGNEFIYGPNVNHVFYYEAFTDMWNSLLTGTGLYGARRDGVFCYDGNPGGPGVFGTLAGGYNRSAWQVDEEPYGLRSNSDTEMDIDLIADDTVQFSTTSPSVQQTKEVASYGLWAMVSDFDIEIEIENFSSSGRFFFRLVADGNNYFDIGREGADLVNSYGYINGGNTYSSVGGITDTLLKFKISRSVDTLSCYYDIGGGWVHLRDLDDVSYTGEMYVVIGLTADVTASCDVKGFTIVSGITTNLVGWAREGFSTERGLNTEFPLNSLIVCTDESVNIIDTDNDLLWMRFLVGGTSISDCSALHNINPGPKPVKAYMKNGILLISYATDDDYSSEGGMILVDFMLDEIRICRTQADGNTGSSLRSWNGARYGNLGALGIKVTNGLIAARNLSGGYYIDRDNWQIKNMRAIDSHFFETSGYIYRAIATEDGLTVQKWRRGYLSGIALSGENINDILYAHSIETDDMRWCWFDEFTGDLFYMSSSKFFQVSKATIDANVSSSGGSFGANTTIDPLDGVRSYNSQVHAVYSYDTGCFYVPSDEGVYQIAWPSGTVTLHYGKVDSVATHDLFNSDYNKVLVVNIKMDDVTPFLLVGAEFGDKKNTSGIIFAVNLLINEVYSKSSIDFGKPIRSVST